MHTKPINSPPAKSGANRFQLPVLDLKFGSLTEGTNIPAPLPSPVQEVPTPPKTPTQDSDKKNATANGDANGNASPKSTSASTVNGGVKRAADEGPNSPTTNRHSLRRLLSRSLLNTTYDEHGAASSQQTSRPPSRTASIMADEKRQKRTSWFRRLRSSDGPDSKRYSTQVVQVKPEPAGPPAPMIPELSALKTKYDTKIGDDLFKGIK